MAKGDTLYREVIVFDEIPDDPSVYRAMEVDVEDRGEDGLYLTLYIAQGSGKGRTLQHVTFANPEGAQHLINAIKRAMIVADHKQHGE